MIRRTNFQGITECKINAFITIFAEVTKTIHPEMNPPAHLPGPAKTKLFKNLEQFLLLIKQLRS